MPWAFEWGKPVVEIQGTCSDVFLLRQSSESKTGERDRTHHEQGMQNCLMDNSYHLIRTESRTSAEPAPRSN